MIELARSNAVTWLEACGTVFDRMVGAQQRVTATALLLH